MLTDIQVSTFQRDGFVNGGLLLSDVEVTELREELDRILEIGPDGFAVGDPCPVSFRDLSGPEGDTPNWQIVNMWEASVAFERLLYHPDLVAAICVLTGQHDLMVWHDQIQYKPATNGGATTWHQDAPLWPVIRPMTPVSAWIPFDDADEGNGCMWMVPGSHRWGNQIEFLRTQGQLKQHSGFGGIAGFTPPADALRQEVQPCPWPVRKGEVSFHHSLTWHGSPSNRSERPRRAIAIHYMTGQAHFDKAGDHIMKQFVDLPHGAPMARAGAHFPLVCRDGEPVGLPKRSA